MAVSQVCNWAGEELLLCKPGTTARRAEASLNGSMDVTFLRSNGTMLEAEEALPVGEVVTAVFHEGRATTIMSIEHLGRSLADTRRNGRGMYVDAIFFFQGIEVELGDNNPDSASEALDLVKRRLGRTDVVFKDEDGELLNGDSILVGRVEVTIA